MDWALGTNLHNLEVTRKHTFCQEGALQMCSQLATHILWCYCGMWEWEGSNCGLWDCQMRRAQVEGVERLKAPLVIATGIHQQFV